MQFLCLEKGVEKMRHQGVFRGGDKLLLRELSVLMCHFFAPNHEATNTAMLIVASEVWLFVLSTPAS